jgi:enoyl-CoA hydratase/carnithine racemase
MPHLERDGDVAIVNIGSDENRFSLGWLDAMESIGDQLDAITGPAALVTVADGRFFSNGLDLDWLGANLDQTETYIGRVQHLLGRILGLGMPTVAAIQGHCFAAGGMLALAHDWQVMRADRGFFCLPEVDLGLPFPPPLDALVRAKLPVPTAIEVMITGKRYGGSEAADRGIVTVAVPEDEVRSTALELVRPLAAKAGPNLGVIKRQMFAETIQLLTQPPRGPAGNAPESLA